MKLKRNLQSNSHLPAANAQSNSLDEAWAGSNEQWWNWYISLADTSQKPVDRERLIPRSEQVAQKVPSIKELQKELAEPYPLLDSQIQQFKTESYIRIKNILSPGALYLLRQELKQFFDRHNNFDPSRQFSSREMMWLESGEITFQHCLNVHGAGANYTTQPRIAFGISYFENGASIVDSPMLISGDWQKFMPGVKPSQPISSPYNPVVYDRNI